MAFRNSKTRRHSEIKQTRPSTKQDFSGEALSKQKTEASLTSLSCNLSRVMTEWSAIFAFGVLFYNIASGIVYQIRREKRPTISEVVVHVKQNRNWFYFKFTAESSSFIFNNFKDRKSTRLNSSHNRTSRMPSSA